MATLLLLTTLFRLATAQTTTLQIPGLSLGDSDSGDTFGSIVGADLSATTVKLSCPQASLDCGLFPYQTLTYGPSTWHLDMSMDGTEFTGTQDCSAVGSTAVVCEEMASGSGANFPGTRTETYEGSSVLGVRVTVTAGAEKLTGSNSNSLAKETAGSSSATGTEGVTQITGSRSGPASSVAAETGSGSGATAAPKATGAAVANAARGGVGLAAVVVCGLLL